jgi:hypothetical protein
LLQLRAASLARLGQYRIADLRAAIRGKAAAQRSADPTLLVQVRTGVLSSENQKSGLLAWGSGTSPWLKKSPLF